MRTPVTVLAILTEFGISTLHGQATGPAPSLACFARDSGRIAYGTMSTAADGDVSGVQFSFAVERGRLRGWVRDAAGEVPPERSLDTVRVTGHGDSLYFSYRGDTGEEYSYRVHATCQGLQGTARLFQTGSSPGVLKEFVVRRAKWIAKP